MGWLRSGGVIAGQQGDAWAEAPCGFPREALRVPDVQGGARGTSIGINWKPIRNATSQTPPSGASESQAGFSKTLGEPQAIPQVIKSRGATEVGALTAGRGHLCSCVHRQEGPACICAPVSYTRTRVC